MIRRLALVVSLVAAGAVPAQAQYKHGPDHVPPNGPIDPALHALLHGEWTGTLTNPQGASSNMNLSVAADSLRKVTVTMATAMPRRSGVARDFVLNGDKVHWTQDLSGTACKASAVLSGTTSNVRDTMNGTIACAGVESKFTLYRKA